METNTNTPEAKQSASAGCDPTTCSASWLPIETAPKDQYLLLCLDGRDWSIGCWNRNLYDSQLHIGDWVNDDGTESTPFMLKPTHWMPLPALPNAHVDLPPRTSPQNKQDAYGG